MPSECRRLVGAALSVVAVVTAGCSVRDSGPTAAMPSTTRAAPATVVDRASVDAALEYIHGAYESVARAEAALASGDETRNSVDAAFALAIAAFRRAAAALEPPPQGVPASTVTNARLAWSAAADGLAEWVACAQRSRIPGDCDTVRTQVRALFEEAGKRMVSLGEYASPGTLDGLMARLNAGDGT